MGVKRKWTKEKCLESTIGYEKIVDWKTNNSGAYKAAITYGWKDECIKNMKPQWTKEKCLEEAEKHEKISDWKKHSLSSYRASIKNGWKNEIREIFSIKNPKIKLQKTRGYWDFERCLEEAKKHDNKKQWRDAVGSSYAAAIKNGWLAECCSHMSNLQKQECSGYWTKEKCLEEAKKHNRPSDWAKNSVGSYSAAIKNGWKNECTVHMIIRKTKPDRYWCDKKNCLEDAKIYTTKNDWFNNSQTAYTTAKRMGYFDECIIPYHYYTEAKLVKIFCDLLSEIKNYNSEIEWIKKNNKSYNLAKKLDLFDSLVTYVDFTDDIFSDFKYKILNLINFKKNIYSKNKAIIKKDMKTKIYDLTLLCDELIKNTYV